MARNKSSVFGAADGLFSVENSNEDDRFDNTHENREAQEMHVVHEVPFEHDEQEIHEVQKEQELHEVLNVQKEQEKQEAQDAHEVQAAQEQHEAGKKLGSTQGRKGEKLKRINIAFDDENYEYVRLESRRRGHSITKFVNDILEQYRLSDEGRISDAEIQ